MKKALALAFLALSVATLTGCGSKEPTASEPITEKTVYFQSGRYYLNGTVITEDGNIWDYTQEIISENPSYHNEPVLVALDDNGTPDIIEDDSIIGLVLDRETAIYDELESALSEDFAIEREGNNIRIGILK